MSWEERVRDAAYTSPGGTRITFSYESVSREVTKRTTAFEFSGVSDAYVQDNGHGSRRYPLRCIFWGADHDLEATAFEEALLERGVGKLEHPLYGTFDVIPFGDITRRDDLKEAANQSVIEVTFWTTTRAVYPDDQSDPESEIQSSLEGWEEASADQLANATELDGGVERAQAAATVQRGLKETAGALDDIAKGDESLSREFDGLKTSIDLSIDSLIADPRELADQLASLTRIPAQAAGDIETIVGAYEDLVESILGSEAADPAAALEGGTQRRARAANDFHISDHRAMSAVAACITAATNYTFLTRPQAISIAERILDLFEDVVEWRDEGFEALGAVEQIGAYQVDEGGSYQAMQRAVGLIVGHLIRVSFTLVPERRIALDRERTIIDLCAELYGTVDDRLDFLAATNNLSGSELLEIPRGRLIRYYSAA